MNIKQKNKRPLLYLGIAIFTLFVVSVYAIYPFYPANGVDVIPDLPSGEMITMHYCPTLESLPSTDSDGTIQLYWNSIEGAIAYQVYFREYPGDWISKLALGITCLLMSLDEGVYSIKVRGYDNAGYSEWSPIEYITVEFPPPSPPPPPDAPTLNAVTLATNTDDKLYLSWNAITGVVSYQVYMNKDGAGWNNIATISTIYYTTDVLTDGNYEFKVRSYNSVDYSGDSKVESFDLSIPTAPSEPVLDAITPTLSDDGLIRLEWDAVDDANKYALYRAKDGGEFIPLIQDSTQIYYDDVIEFDGNYSYKVKAGNDVDYSDFSNEQSVEVQLIGVPESPIMNQLTYTVVGDITTIQLSWNEVDCDSYNVYRKIDAGDYILIGENVLSTGYSEALTNAGAYFYRVSATNICGESEMSDFAPIVIPEEGEPIVRGDGRDEELEEPPIEPTDDYNITYILLVVLGVLIIPVVLILIKRKKR